VIDIYQAHGIEKYHKYVTYYMIWCVTVANGERENASIAEMDAARRALAVRADNVPAERKGLQKRYDAILARLLAAGWK
jgi:hypothetical protein